MTNPSPVPDSEAAEQQNNSRLRAELAALRADHDDLQMLYQATIDHGEAVEDQLAEKNLLLEKTQRRLEAELADASGYVLSILPEKRTDRPATDWLLVPSTELGGDSLGYHDIDEDRLAVYLMDVCGHGVGAALLSVTVMNVVRASSLPHTDFADPAAVLASLNDAFPMERQNDMFFTCWYGVYTRSTRELRYASGGHPPALHTKKKRGRRSASWTPLATPGTMALGALPGMRYKTATTKMAPGDSLLVLSDGTFEIDPPDGGQIGVDGFADHCVANPGSLKAIFDWVKGIQGGDLPDDFSLLRIDF